MRLLISLIKVKSKLINLGSFYGDLYCGLIDQDNEWCLVGGSILILWNKKENFGN